MQSLRAIGLVLFGVGAGLAIPLTSGFVILFLLGGIQSLPVMATLGGLYVTGVSHPPSSAPLLVFGCSLMVVGGVAVIAWFLGSAILRADPMPIGGHHAQAE